MPPSELRNLVGPTDPRDFDNPTGAPIYQRFGLSPDIYDSVFDFGCGCGRLARQLLQQNTRPRRYVGIDPNREMIEWCRKRLSLIDSGFQFFHHDVYSPSYAPTNSLRLAEPFPVQDGEFTLFIAHSVFTHLCLRQTEYYLGELHRILKPGGIAFTSWFFFDRDSFPFLPVGPYCLYTSESDFAEAAIYDRRWFIDTVRRVGLAVKETTCPGMAGHQWGVLLEKRTSNSVDAFPLGEDGSEWLCGATLRPMVQSPGSSNPVDKPREVASPTGADGAVRDLYERPAPPALFGPLAELQALRALRHLTAPGTVIGTSARFARRVYRRTRQALKSGS